MEQLWKATIVAVDGTSLQRGSLRGSLTFAWKWSTQLEGTWLTGQEWQ
jgi:hypothetical protein